MNEDFSNILNKFSDILKEKDIDLNNIVGGKSTPPTNYDVCKNNCDNENFNNVDSCNQNQSNDFDFNLDIETILKIKEILTSINKNSHTPRNNLLHSLKPYLQDDKKEKLEKYIKIANLLSVLDTFDSSIKLNFTESNYDFILILTLFLLLF